MSEAKDEMAEADKAYMAHLLELGLPLLFLVTESQQYKFIEIFIAALAVERLFQLPVFVGCFKLGEVGVFVYFFTAWVHYLDQFWPRFFLAAALACLANPIFTVYLLLIVPYGELVKLIFEDKRLLLLWPVQLASIAYFSTRLPVWLSTNELRKVYHFAAFFMFTPALFMNPALLKIAFGFALILALVVERLRTSNYIKSAELDAFMKRCKSEKLDTGGMILSHIYLLLGCAFPVWLAEEGDRVSALAGIISLGLGDSVASLVGQRYGRHPLRPPKTLEGTAAGALVMTLAFWGFGLSLVKAASVGVLAAAWETGAELNDNLTLPLITFYLIKSFK